MTNHVVLLPPAIADVEWAVTWYNSRVKGLGQLYLHDLNRQLNRIREFPAIYPQLNATCRRSHLQRFPYTLVYRVQPSVIEVVAVMHHRSDPEVTEDRAETH